ncbi:uncharacterized protein DEA37_0006841 [Paragonimus westermani]|uniref:Uncharacterized protein n=1 Tax=Paragonimus westermani TaxID=34504 RepID=A0A5J4NZ29_9TREM|nr:uncharacterized protein DEA37_0006841 [Paragonimus westermani]
MQYNAAIAKTRQPLFWGFQINVSSFFTCDSHRRVQSTALPNTRAFANLTIGLKTVASSQLGANNFQYLIAVGFFTLENRNKKLIAENFQTTRLSSSITCESNSTLCSTHANCIQFAHGVGCACRYYWKDKNPINAGTECKLDPMVITLIVFGILLLIGLIVLLVLLIKRTSKIGGTWTLLVENPSSDSPHSSQTYDH